MRPHDDEPASDAAAGPSASSAAAPLPPLFVSLPEPPACDATMRALMNARAMPLDRAVLLLLVSLNVSVLSRLGLSAATWVGALNGSLAAALLAASLLSPGAYAHNRQLPVVLMRLLVSALPLFNDSVSPFAGNGAGSGPWVAFGRGAFMLLVSVSWSVGLLLACFLFLPPTTHLAVQALCLALQLPHNRLGARGGAVGLP